MPVLIARNSHNIVTTVRRIIKNRIHLTIVRVKSIKAVIGRYPHDLLLILIKPSDTKIFDSDQAIQLITI